MNLRVESKIIEKLRGMKKLKRMIGDSWVTQLFILAECRKLLYYTEVGGEVSLEELMKMKRNLASARGFVMDLRYLLSGLQRLTSSEAGYATTLFRRGVKAPDQELLNHVQSYVKTIRKKAGFGIFQIGYYLAICDLSYLLFLFHVKIAQLGVDFLCRKSLRDTVQITSSPPGILITP